MEQPFVDLMDPETLIRFDNALGLDAMGPDPQPPGRHHSTCSLDMTAVTSAMTTFAAPGVSAADPQHASHDDLCLDHCYSVGLGLTGYHTLGHRGAQQAAQLDPHLRTYMALGLHSANGLSPQFNSPHLDYQGPTQAREQQQPQPPQHPRPTENHDENDEDLSSCCDSKCTMDGRCDDMDCADGPNTCTDNNCPGRPAALLPPEIVDGANALIRINHAPVGYRQPEYGQAQQHHPPFHLSMAGSSNGPAGGLGLDGLGLGFPMNPSQPTSPSQTLFLPEELTDVTSHLLTFHDPPDASTCIGPCPVDNPLYFNHCQFPILDDFPTFHPTFDSSPAFNNHKQGLSLSQPQPNNTAHHRQYQPQNIHACGAQLSDSREWLEHFRQVHRPNINNVLTPYAWGGLSGPAQGMSLASSTASSTEGMSSPSSSITPFHTPNPAGSARSSISIPATALTASFQNWAPGHSSGPGMSLSRMATPTENRRSSSARKRPAPVTAVSLDPVILPPTPDSNDFTSAAGSDTAEHTCLWRTRTNRAGACGAVFPNSEALFLHIIAGHMENVQKGPTGYCCEWSTCTRGSNGTNGFPQKSKIERHIRAHVGHKPYICMQCNTRFSAKQALAQHELIHANSKPLECKKCRKTFRHKNALIMHERTHSGAKPLKCPTCGKAFSESSNLAKHKRTHDPRGRYSCPHQGCERTFHRQDQLRRHFKVHGKTGSAGGEGDPTAGGGAEDSKEGEGEEEEEEEEEEEGGEEQEEEEERDEDEDEGEKVEDRSTGR